MEWEKLKQSYHIVINLPNGNSMKGLLAEGKKKMEVLLAKKGFFSVHHRNSPFVRE